MQSSGHERETLPFQVEQHTAPHHIHHSHSNHSHHTPASVVQPGMYVADLEGQAMNVHYDQQFYPHALSSPDDVVYTNSNFFSPVAAAVGGYDQYYPGPAPHYNYTFMMDGSYGQPSNPANMGYVPGMPVQSNNFGGDSGVYMGQENTQDNSFYNSRGSPHHSHSRGGAGGMRPSPRSQTRGRGRSGYRNMHGKYPEMHNTYNHRYDYESPPYRGHKRGRGHYDHYDNYNFEQRGRGASNHGARGIPSDELSGNGDKRNHGKKLHHSSSNQDSRDSQMQKNNTFQKERSSNSDLAVTAKESGSMSTVGESQNGKNDNSKLYEVNDTNCNSGQSFDESSSKSQRFSHQSRDSNRYDQMSYSRGGRGRDTRGRGRNGSGASGYQTWEKRKYKSGNQEDEENDESQRGTLTEQLSTNKYECMVCCDNIYQEAPVWSCENCYHVFHLSCIRTWAQSSLCKDTRSWRCPGCQNVSSKVPSQYRCFCGRRRDPQYIRGETPHSCGETCRRKRKGDCKHPCTILCHPGPCPPCSAMVWMKCDCGKDRKHVRCSAVVTFKCDKVCGQKLNCREHSCELTCHSYPCPPCSVSKSQECFCKKATRKTMCGTEEFKMISFSCEKVCGRMLGCGNHVCEEPCHPGECAPCALMPGNLTTCCCGKTPLSKLDAPVRQSCLDAVPSCGQICNKPMACGLALQPHLCDKKCHNGECGPCSKETFLRCECGATEKKMPCEVAVTFNDQNPFKCQRRCGKKKTCGRHKCADNCCMKDIHICEIVCGQKLNCGIHKCEELCHRGNCKRCLQASFDELACYCGAVVLEPPVPCGTRRPECRNLCTREHDCDHPVRHTCHGDEKCPPCTELTDKMCVGGHMMRKNVPCHVTNISCGYPCNKLLPCGVHKCPKTCHKGDCLDEGAVCTQPCTKMRPQCGHPCGAPCHSGECPDVSCKTEITITCPCGNRTSKAQCSMGGDLSADIAQFQRLSVQSMAESGGESVDLSQFTQTKRSNKRLDCDTNCAIIERNRRLALALELKNPDLNAKLGNPTFTDFLKDFAKKNPKFAMSVEKSLNDLVQSSKQSLQPNRSHAFQSMNRDQRRFVHELSELYGCQTQSYDYEPNKNVVATAVKDKCWLPNVTLTQVILKDQLPKAPPPIPSFKTQGVTFTVLEKKKTAPAPKETPTSSRAWEQTGATAASSSASKSEPAIDYFDFTD